MSDYITDDLVNLCDELNKENASLRRRCEKMREALVFVVERENFAFTECEVAELIWNKCKQALEEDAG